MIIVADIPLFDRRVVGPALTAAARGLDPHNLARSPALLAIGALAVVMTAVALVQVASGSREALLFAATAAASWLLILAANYVDAAVERRRWIRLRRLRSEQPQILARRASEPTGSVNEFAWNSCLKAGDVILVRAGEIVPRDGEVVDGVGYVDDSAISGSLIPVWRRAACGEDLVVGGTRLVSHWLKVRVIDLESGHREPARGLRCHAMHQAAFDLLIGGAAALTLFLATALDTL